MPSSIRNNFRQGNNYTEKQIQGIYQCRVTTTSHYKMPCSCCGNFINRGDKITQVVGGEGKLRPRGKPTCAPIEQFKAITPWRNEYTSYIPTRNRWVHLNCLPSHWQTYGWVPQFNSGRTHYYEIIERRRAIAAFDPDWSENWCDIPSPEWKHESERIEKGVVAKFQAIWRRYITRKKFHAERYIAKLGSTIPEVCLKGDALNQRYATLNKQSMA